MTRRIDITGFIVRFACLLTACTASQKPPTRHVEITAAQEKLRDPEGFRAIKEVHGLMDDDQSGSIDRYESADFLKEDMKIGGGLDRARREKAFHHNNDESITVDDLWESWFASEERAWGADEIADWLRNVVRLPQYAPNFQAAKVTGIALPRMATQNSSYIFNVLGIKNFVHRQKLQLKALDLVLFGFQDGSSRFKDIALAALLVVLVSVLALFKMHRNRAKRQMAELATKLTELKTMENAFERGEHNNNKLNEEHIEELRNRLREEESRRLELNGCYESIPYALQPLLRRTYELECAHIDAQKTECLNEMRDAKEFVDRMRRKQTGLMASFKIATGTTAGTEDIDSRIFALKVRMEKIKLAMDECQQRWSDIESICGFSIAGPFGAVINNSFAHGAGGATNGLIDENYAEYDASTLSNGAPGGGSSFDAANDNAFESARSVNGTRLIIDANSGGVRYPFQHSISQQQLLLQQLHNHQQLIAPCDSASGCVTLAHETNSIAPSSLVSSTTATTAAPKKLKPAHRQLLALNHVLLSPSSPPSQFSEDSSSISSSISKGMKKSKKLSNFLRRKLSKA